MRRTVALLSFIALASTVSLSAADLSGTWALSADIAGNAVGATCALTQASAAISGNCKSDLGDSKVTGTADGQKMKFQYDIDVMGMTFTLTYDGTLDEAGKEMKGAVDVGGMANGTFSAKKQ